MLPITLLQADVTEIITPHLADQMFTVVILVAIVVWMVRRQKEEREERQKEMREERLEREKLQERLEAYMDEDRRTMLDVIERNTRVMERMEDHLEIFKHKQ